MKTTKPSNYGRLSRFGRIAALGALSIVSVGALAAPVDLTTWSALTLDFPGAQGAGNWVLQPGNTEVRQTVNADPSFYRNNLNQTQYSMDGNWLVQSGTGDDDYMGFAFGMQNSSNFYLFDWKSGSQGSSGQYAAEGMTIKRFTGATGSGLADLSISEFWENEESVGDMSVLATNHSSTAGWVPNVLYNFHLDFNLTPGDIRIIVSNGATTLWDAMINDDTFTGGEFAFFNNSQGGVRYSGFDQTGGVLVVDGPPTSVPEPGSLALLLASLGLLAMSKMLRKNKGQNKDQRFQLSAA